MKTTFHPIAKFLRARFDFWILAGLFLWSVILASVAVVIVGMFLLVRAFTG
ncbi:MAG: hypothetical protein L0Z50_10600 [Verrucomicrobiales bacterium]|nr:hypothetical protein [Verrucomicrobiales bacterium]